MTAARSLRVPTRPFGRTSIPVSILAFGGWHLGVPKTDADAIRLVHTAIDAGVTFLDNAWDYNDGLSEARMGKALGRPARPGVPDDQGLHARSRRQGGDAAARGFAAPAEDGPPRLVADPRGGVRRRAGAAFRAAAESWRRWIKRAEAGQGPLRRLHRPQGSAAAPGDAGATTTRGTPASCRSTASTRRSAASSAGASGAEPPRHRRHRHEELGWRCPGASRRAW